MRLVSIVEYPKKKRTMKVFSNQPGIQFYTGNFLPRDGMLGKVDIDNRYALIFLKWFYVMTVHFIFYRVVRIILSMEGFVWRLRTFLILSTIPTFLTGFFIPARPMSTTWRYS